MGDFTMPALGASMETGTLVQWLKQPGDAVKRGEIIAVVDTEKGAIEIEVFEDGVVTDLVVAPGTPVPVGTVLAHIAASTTLPPGAGPPLPPGPGQAEPRRRAVSPAARRRATEIHVDLEAAVGTGPDGAVTLADVEKLAPAAAGEREKAEQPAAPPKDDLMRHAIATAMARSKREIPHAYLGATIDVTRALEWMTAANTQRSVTERLLPAALLLRATVAAVADAPEVNGHWLDGRSRASAAVHLGVAITLRGGGLVAPAIRDAHLLDLDGLRRSLGDLVSRARSNALRGSDVGDATLTVTNLGDQGVDSVFGIIVPPQVAIVGFGRIVERPAVVDGRILPRRMVTASLSFDHRVLDGHRAGLFLASVDRRLQHPEAL